MSEETLVPKPTETHELTLEGLIADLTGFGIEETEEILTVTAGGKTIRLKISNIPTEDEIEALIAVEDSKNYIWIQRIKTEILSRSITWIAMGAKGPGINLRTLSENQQFVVDPTTKSETTWRVALRNVISTWGQEIMTVLWKVLMIHSQRIEDRLREAFPDTVTMTQVEKRFMDLAIREIEDTTKEIIQSSVQKIMEDVDQEPETPKS